MRIDGVLPPNSRSFALAAAQPVEGVAGPTGSLWRLYVVTWLVLMTASALAYRLGVPWQLIGIIMAPLTLAGIVWKPVFGICLMGAILPIGTAIFLPGTVTAERAIGLLFGIGAAANVLLTRKGLRFVNPVGLGLASIAMLSVLSILWAEYPQVASFRAWTIVQMFIYTVLVMSVCRTAEDLRWPLRIFVLACVASFLGGLVLGVRGGEMARFAFTVGEERINPNAQGAMYGLGVLSALYLYRQEPVRAFRWAYLVSLLILPVGVLRTGGRKAGWFLGLVLALPLLFKRSTLRSSRLALAAIGLLVLMGLAIGVFHTYLLPTRTAQRFTDTSHAIQSFWFRLSLITDSFRYVTKHPLGAGIGCFVTSGGIRTVVHNDLFYLMSNLGLPGAIAFTAFAASLAVRVARMRPGLDKWFACSVVAYALLLGTGGTYIFGKNYWLFLSFAWLLAQFQREAETVAGREALEAGFLRRPVQAAPGPALVHGAAR
jgi:hypothetical protein